MHWADKHYTTKRMPMGTLRTCSVKGCTYFNIVRPGHGRGYGMREGNKARGAMIQHIKQAHPELAPDKSKGGTS